MQVVFRPLEINSISIIEQKNTSTEDSKTNEASLLAHTAFGFSGINAFQATISLSYAGAAYIRGQNYRHQFASSQLSFGLSAACFAVGLTACAIPKLIKSFKNPESPRKSVEELVSQSIWGGTQILFLAGSLAIATTAVASPVFFILGSGRSLMGICEKTYSNQCINGSVPYEVNLCNDYFEYGINYALASVLATAAMLAIPVTIACGNALANKVRKLF